MNYTLGVAPSTDDMAKDAATRGRWATAALVAGLAAPIAYMVQRGFEITIAGDTATNPALILRSTHAAFYWRAAIATWWAFVITAALWRRLGRGELDTRDRALSSLALFAAAALPLAAWLLP